MPNITGHGGGCCGIQHLRGWGATPREVLQHLDVEEGEIRALAIEIVLAGDQVNDEVFARLNTLGYREAFNFLNPNSNNQCYVFYRHPRNYAGDEMPIPARAVEVRVETPVAAPQLYWTLKRVRIVNGVIGERTVVHQFPATQVNRPVERTINRHIQASWNGGNYPRRVYEVVQEELHQ